MTNSHWLGLIAFGVFALFGVLAWVLSYKHPQITGDPAMQRKTRRWAVLFPLIGVVFGYGGFKIDHGVRVVTLHEVMVEGTLEVKPGEPAPVRRVEFHVEHPGVEHDLLISPTSTLSHPARGDVDVSFSLEGPGGESLVPQKTERFTVTGGSRRRRDWDSTTVGFTPSVGGPHAVEVTPLTTGIAGIHVRISDPLKRDGKRMPGY